MPEDNTDLGGIRQPFMVSLLSVWLVIICLTAKGLGTFGKVKNISSYKHRVTI